MAQEVGVVPVLPDENEVDGRHEKRHERTTLGRAGERIRGDAEPAGVVLGVVRPKLLFRLELDVEPPLVRAELAQTSSFAMRIASTKSSWRR
jgi:hypothetical protein